MRSQVRTSVSFRALAQVGLLGGVAVVFVTSSALAQQVSVQTREPLTVAPAVSIHTSDGSTEVQSVGWRNRYYGRQYGAYYGPPRARYYSGYRGYYDNPSPYYGGYGYGYRDYGYRGGYYGTPRVGYYDGYYGGGAVCVGPMRFGWR